MRVGLWMALGLVCALSACAGNDASNAPAKSALAPPVTAGLHQFGSYAGNGVKTYTDGTVVTYTATASLTEQDETHTLFSYSETVDGNTTQYGYVFASTGAGFYNLQDPTSGAVFGTAFCTDSMSVCSASGGGGGYQENTTFTFSVGQFTSVGMSTSPTETYRWEDSFTLNAQ